MYSLRVVLGRTIGQLPAALTMGCGFPGDADDIDRLGRWFQGRSDMNTARYRKDCR